MARLRRPRAKEDRGFIALRCVRGFWRQFLVDQRFHLAPHLGIALDFRVRLDQDSVEPGISLATNGIRFVVVAEVSQDFRPRRILGANLGPPVHDSVGLVEIDRLSHVGGNHGVILADLGHAIHLDGEQHGNAIPLQLARQGYGFRRAPAMAKDDDAGILLFFGG